MSTQFFLPSDNNYSEESCNRKATIKTARIDSIEWDLCELWARNAMQSIKAPGRRQSILKAQLLLLIAGSYRIMKWVNGGDNNLNQNSILLHSSRLQHYLGDAIFRLKKFFSTLPLRMLTQVRNTWIGKDSEDKEKYKKYDTNPIILEIISEVIEIN